MTMRVKVIVLGLIGVALICSTMAWRQIAPAAWVEYGWLLVSIAGLTIFGGIEIFAPWFWEPTKPSAAVHAFRRGGK